MQSDHSDNVDPFVNYPWKKYHHGSCQQGFIYAHQQTRPGGAHSKAPMSEWVASPFSVALPVTVDHVKIVEKRRARMESEGYQTPAKYYDMDLATLTKKAQQADVFAMLQLGEQYWSESDVIQHDPAAEVQGNSRDIAKKYFAGAIQGGATHLAAVVSSKLVADNEVVEAYAWHLMSEKFNDTSNIGFERSSASFSRLSAEQRAEGNRRYGELAQKIGVQL
ncbi:hypothetical protein AAKU55_002295 [Oxalobacteraceae bacterium GrIS 1.11]